VPLSERFDGTLLLQEDTGDDMTAFFTDLLILQPGRAILIICSDVLCIAGHRFHLTF